MTTRTFFALLMRSRLRVFIAERALAAEKEQLQTLKQEYGGKVPLSLWTRQQRRVMIAHLQLSLHRQRLDDLTRDWRN